MRDHSRRRPFPGVGRKAGDELEYDEIEYAALPVVANSLFYTAFRSWLQTHNGGADLGRDGAGDWSIRLILQSEDS